MLRSRSLLGGAFVACALVILGTLLTCSVPAHAAPQKTSITFWHAMGPDKEAVLKEFLADFNRKNPAIQVEARFVGSRNAQWGNDYNALYRAILEGLAAKTPPDVAMVYENWTTQLIDYGYLVPVQEYLAGAEGLSAAELADFVPTFREANVYGGKLWTLPFNKSIYVLYYNADRLKAAKLSAPRTWEALRAAARRLTPQDRSFYGMILQPNVDALGHWLYANGGDFVEGTQAVFNNKRGVAALRYWVDMVNADRTVLPSFDPQRGFAEGKAAMYIHTTSAYMKLLHNGHFKLGVAPLPGAAGLSPRVAFAGTNLAMFRTRPDRQAASWKLIRYLTSPAVTAKWALRTGYLPVRLSGVKGSEFQAFLSKHPDYRTSAIDMLRYARVQPKVSAWESIRGIIDDAMFEAISRRSSPQDALNRAVAISNDLIRKLLGGTQP